VAFRTTVARFVHSALRRRRLLVLAGKIVFADGAAKLPEHFGRLALGVQGLARLAAEGLPSEHGLDSVPFVLLGDRRQAHNLPLLLRQYMARQVVLVQPVHDQDDRTRKLVVQSAAERVVVPLVGRLPLGLRQRFLGLQRSSMTIMSAPRPVSTPPTEVAMRKACAVVSNSR
jgi:hypothetical protein